MYLKEVVTKHGILVLIICDRDPRFASNFWKSLQKALGTSLDMSTAYHSQTDRQSERTIHTSRGYCKKQRRGSSRLNKGFKPLAIDKRARRLNAEKPMESSSWDKVMLKVSLLERGVRFGIRGKVKTLCYVSPFQVLKIGWSRWLQLELPQELSRVHNTFHVSNLKKCYSDDPLVVPWEGLQVDDKLHFVEEPVEMMDREVKQLRRSRDLIVKVR
ncbi:putative reverse transcriptase domain-containing protein [Tanacetum coccineum]